MPRTRCRWRDCDPDKNEKQYTGCRYFLWHVMSSAATEVKLINPQLAIKSCRSGCGEKMSVGSLTQAMWAVVCAPGASRSLVVLSSRCRDFTLAPFDRIVTFGLAVSSLRICSTPVDHQLQHNVFCYATVWGPICFIVSHAWEILFAGMRTQWDADIFFIPSPDIDAWWNAKTQQLYSCL